MRLLTRSDFDGLACAVLLKEAGVIDDRKFVHPKDIQDGKIEATENDVLANIPYVEGAGMWFDHHSSEFQRGSTGKDFKGDCRIAPSAAHVIYDYYGGKDKFGDHLGWLLEAVDKSDTASFTIDEVLHPTGGTLLSFIMDARTGLGRYRTYRISNYQLMDKLIELCQHLSLEEILEDPDVKERIERYFADEGAFKEFLKEHSWSEGNVIITDLREFEDQPAGNRFMIYALFPEQNISIRLIKGKLSDTVVFAVGHSIFNKTSKTDVGKLMLSYGGGGHPPAGTCQVKAEDADRALKEMIKQMNEEG
ncbi:MAG: exopolyphosphatase [Chloroflexi bacterium]|nr:exopolyphosphatase [Chloroflexota bacterium]